MKSPITTSWNSCTDGPVADVRFEERALVVQLLVRRDPEAERQALGHDLAREEMGREGLDGRLLVEEEKLRQRGDRLQIKPVRPSDVRRHEVVQRRMEKTSKDQAAYNHVD